MAYKIGDLTLNRRRQRYGIAYYHPWGGNYRLSDILVGKDHLYVVHFNLDYVSVYSKNPDGTFGNIKYAKRYWRGQDNYLSYICAFGSSVPYGYAMYVEDGKDYLVGWSSSHNALFRWEIDPVTFYPKNRTQFDVCTKTMGGYGRGGWDGGRFVYFFNQNGFELWRWDLANKNKNLEFIHDLNNDWSHDSSYTGTGMLICNDKMYWGDGANDNDGLLACYDINQNSYLGHVTYSTINSYVDDVSALNGSVGTIQLTAMHPDIAYYFAYGSMYVEVIEVDNPYMISFDTFSCSASVHSEDVKVSFTLDEVNESFKDAELKYRVMVGDTGNHIQSYPSSGYIEGLQIPFEQCIELPNEAFTKVGGNTAWIELVDSIEQYERRFTFFVDVNNKEAGIEIELSSDTIHGEYLVYHATVIGEHTDKFTYRLLINDVALDDWSTSKYSSPMILIRSFKPSLFDTGENTITLEVKEYFKDAVTEHSKSVTITKENSVPTVDVELHGHTLSIDLDDSDGDLIQFKVSINDEQVLPAAGYSSAFKPQFHLDYTIPYDTLEIGQNNIIRVDVKDSTGDGAYWEEERLIRYAGLMFRDKDGVFYTSDIGELLRYLDMGDVVANRKSKIEEIYLENTYGFPVRKLKLNAMQGDLDPVYEVVELSKTNDPFTAEPELLFDSFLNPGDDVKFYVRINAKDLAVGGGNFKVRAVADPMWQVGGV